MWSFAVSKIVVADVGDLTRFMEEDSSFITRQLKGTPPAPPAKAHKKKMTNKQKRKKAIKECEKKFSGKKMINCLKGVFLKYPVVKPRRCKAKCWEVKGKTRCRTFCAKCPLMCLGKGKKMKCKRNCKYCPLKCWKMGKKKHCWRDCKGCRKFCKTIKGKRKCRNFCPRCKVLKRKVKGKTVKRRFCCWTFLKCIPKKGCKRVCLNKPKRKLMTLNF